MTYYFPCNTIIILLHQKYHIQVTQWPTYRPSSVPNIFNHETLTSSAYLMEGHCVKQMRAGRGRRQHSVCIAFLTHMLRAQQSRIGNNCTKTPLNFMESPKCGEWSISGKCFLSSQLSIEITPGFCTDPASVYYFTCRRLSSIISLETHCLWEFCLHLSSVIIQHIVFLIMEKPHSKLNSRALLCYQSLWGTIDKETLASCPSSLSFLSQSSILSD
jgi:hypothetical protein